MSSKGKGNEVIELSDTDSDTEFFTAKKRTYAKPLREYITSRRRSTVVPLCLLGSLPPSQARSLTSSSHHPWGRHRAHCHFRLGL